MSRFSFSATRDDIQACLQIIVCLLGIGSLGIPFAFAKTGLFLGVVLFLMVATFNIYGSILLSRCLLKATVGSTSRSNKKLKVQTYADLAEYIDGPCSRKIVTLVQVATCFLLPLIYLVLGGGNLLPVILEDLYVVDFLQKYVSSKVAVDAPGFQAFCIFAMAITLIPIVLVRNLKDGFLITLIGALSALASDLIAVCQTVALQPWDKYVPAKIMTSNIPTVFGSFAFAYGAAVIIPTAQRGHSSPVRMTRNIILSMSSVSVLYLVYGILGYSQFGCASPTNMLFSMKKNWWRLAAFSLKQVNIMTSFGLYMSPMLHQLEKIVLEDLTEHRINILDTPLNGSKNNLFEGRRRRHSSDPILVESHLVRKRGNSEPPLLQEHWLSVSSSFMETTPKPVNKAISFEDTSECDVIIPYTPINMSPSHEYADFSLLEDESSKQVSQYTFVHFGRSTILRMSMLSLEVVLAVVGKKFFREFADILGATAQASICVIVPCILYMMQFYRYMSVKHRLFCCFVLCTSIMLSILTVGSKVKDILNGGVHINSTRRDFCKLPLTLTPTPKPMQKRFSKLWNPVNNN